MTEHEKCPKCKTQVVSHFKRDILSIIPIKRKWYEKYKGHMIELEDHYQCPKCFHIFRDKFKQEKRL